MTSQNSNGGRGNPWGSGANPGPPDLEALVRQARNRGLLFDPDLQAPELGRGGAAGIG